LERESSGKVYKAISPGKYEDGEYKFWQKIVFCEGGLF